MRAFIAVSATHISKRMFHFCTLTTEEIKPHPAASCLKHGMYLTNGVDPAPSLVVIVYPYTAH